MVVLNISDLIDRMILERVARSPGFEALVEQELSELRVVTTLEQRVSIAVGFADYAAGRFVTQAEQDKQDSEQAF